MPIRTKIREGVPIARIAPNLRISRQSMAERGSRDAAHPHHRTVTTSSAVATRAVSELSCTPISCSNVDAREPDDTHLVGRRHRLPRAQLATPT